MMKPESFKFKSVIFPSRFRLPGGDSGFRIVHEVRLGQELGDRGRDGWKGQEAGTTGGKS